MDNGEILCEGKTVGFTDKLGKYLNLQSKQFKEIIETEITIHEEMQIIPESGQSWTQEYKEGYIDGLKRTIELLNYKN